MLISQIFTLLRKTWSFLKDSNIKSIEDLKGKKVGVQTGSIQEEKAAEFKSK